MPRWRGSIATSGIYENPAGISGRELVSTVTGRPILLYRFANRTADPPSAGGNMSESKTHLGVTDCAISDPPLTTGRRAQIARPLRRRVVRARAAHRLPDRSQHDQRRRDGTRKRPGKTCDPGLQTDAPLLRRARPQQLEDALHFSELPTI